MSFNKVCVSFAVKCETFFWNCANPIGSYSTQLIVGVAGNYNFDLWNSQTSFCCIDYSGQELDSSLICNIPCEELVAIWWWEKGWKYDECGVYIALEFCWFFFTGSYSTQHAICELSNALSSFFNGRICIYPKNFFCYLVYRY